LNPSPLRKLFWILTALAALILLAPMAASAHEGGHRRPEAISQLAAHHAHSSKSMDRVIAAAPAQVTVAQSAGFGANDGDPSCTSGCCFGMGCCAGTIVSEGPALDPPAGPDLLLAHAPRPLASARMTSLLEPPNARA
jgi:hypothetical protein